MLNKFCLTLIIPVVLLSSHYSLTAQSAKVNQSSASRESRFRIEFDGGLGYLIGDSKPATEQLVNSGLDEAEVNRYYKKLKLGMQAGASVHYMTGKNLGIGLDYRIFSNRSKMMGYLYSQDNTTFYGPISEKIYTNFVGPSLYYQDKMRAKRWTFISSVAVGMAFYRDELNLVVAPALITASSPAVHYGLGFEYSLYGKLSAALHVSGFYAELKKIKVNDGQTKTDIDLGKASENLSRVNLSAGIHYRF